MLEYEDGTPATASQVAKDITTFLMWTANHEYDDRKRMAIKVNHRFYFILTYLISITLMLFIYVRLLEYWEFSLLLHIISNDTNGRL